MNARRLDWGYVAYPPLTPLLARIELTLFGSALPGMRLFPAVAQGAVAVLVGDGARHRRPPRGANPGRARGRHLARRVTTGMLIQYMSFDYLWWVLVAFFTVRLLATENPRWWLGIGAGIGLGMQTKYTMAYFVIGLAAGVLLTPARRYLRSAWLWAGAGVALLIILPNLIWQAQHHFIALDFLSAIHARDIQWGRMSDFLPKQLYEEVNPFVLPLAIAGLIWCFFARGRRFRTLGWMYVTTFLLLVVSRGRSYYVAPAYAMLLAAGAVWLEGWLGNRTPAVRRIVVGVVCVFVVLGVASGSRWLSLSRRSTQPYGTSLPRWARPCGKWSAGRIWPNRLPESTRPFRRARSRAPSSWLGTTARRARSISTGPSTAYRALSPARTACGRAAMAIRPRRR